VSAWPTRTIDELKAKTNAAIAIGPFGSRMKSDCYVASGIPVIRGNNISDTRELVGEMVYIAPEKAEEVRSSIIFADDLFFPHRGSIGLVGIVPRNGEKRYVQSSSLMKLTCDRELVEPLYLFYFFRSEQGRHELLKNASTVGTPGIGQPLASLKSIRVPLPPLPEQRAIASVLGSLDDKIELNRRMNETLEALAQSLFKSWFVDATQSALPKGWREMPFTETVEIIGGGTPKTSVVAYWGGDIPWFSVVDAPQGSDLFVIDTEKKITQAGVDNSSTQVLPVGTTIISARGTVGKVALVGVPMAMNQSCYGLRGKVGKKGFHTYFVTRALVSRLQQHAHGSVFDTITRDTLAGVQVALSPAEVVEQFEEKVSPLMERIRNNLHESRTLAALRDALLPKLLSGELRVAEVETVVHNPERQTV